MTLDALLERYRSHLQLRNFAPRGIETNFAALQLLFRFLAETKSAPDQSDVIGLTTAKLHDFQRWHFYQPTTRGTARSVAYQNRVLSGIKSLFHFLQEENFIARDPAAALHYGREPETLPRNILTVREARQIIETPDVHTVRGYRDRTILEVLYSTGIRKQEL
ncbi:MAG: tyrosine-type recombinase/integrase, partial [Chthoniobacterales bacterium]